MGNVIAIGRRHSTDWATFIIIVQQVQFYLVVVKWCYTIMHLLKIWQYNTITTARCNLARVSVYCHWKVQKYLARRCHWSVLHVLSSARAQRQWLSLSCQCHCHTQTRHVPTHKTVHVFQNISWQPYNCLHHLTIEIPLTFNIYDTCNYYETLSARRNRQFRGNSWALVAQKRCKQTPSRFPECLYGPRAHVSIYEPYIWTPSTSCYRLLHSTIVGSV